MGKLKPIEQIAEDVKNKKIKDNDVVMLKLDELEPHHHPVGYIWNTEPRCPLRLYQTSGMATTSDDENFDKIGINSIDISKGDYLGYPIIGYEIIRRAESRKESS